VGDEKHAADVEAKMPKRVKKKRPITADDGVRTVPATCCNALYSVHHFATIGPRTMPEYRTMGAWARHSVGRELVFSAA
jgi:hypothetical protein